MNHLAKPPAPLTAMALHEALLASGSATAVLERLCGCKVTILRNRGAPVAPDPQQRLRLQLDEATAWIHRAVQLQAGTLKLSQADLWYVPERLDPDMAAALLATTIPFGRIVEALNPSRRTLAAHFGRPGDTFALHHHALLTVERPDGSATPIAEVHERYFAASFAP